MATVAGGGRTTVSMAEGDVLSVVSTNSGIGSVVRLADRPGSGGSQGTTNVGSGETVTLGPFPNATRFEIACQSGVITYSTDQADLAALNQTGGSMEVSAAYGDAGSHQVVAIDLELTAGAGTGEAGDSDFLAPIMGNVLGTDLTGTHNYLAGIIGADSITGTKATELQKGAVVGVVMDGVTEADAAVVAVIDGGDPSSVTRANAAFAARMNNNNAGSGVDYGLDLYDAGRSETLFTGGGLPLPIAKAALRLNNQVCVIVAAGAPTSGASGTGDNYAGPGSLYIDITGANIYVQIGAITAPDWKLVTRAA